MLCKIRQQALKSALYVHMTNQSFKEQDACMHACSLTSFVHGILQARELEWVAMPSSREFSRIRD